MPEPTAPTEPTMRWSLRPTTTSAGTYYEILESGEPRLYAYSHTAALRVVLALNTFDHLLAAQGCPSAQPSKFIQ